MRGAMASRRASTALAGRIELRDASRGVERDQVDALEVAPPDRARELERQLATVPPLTVVGEAFDGLEDEPEQVMDDVAVPKGLPVGRRREHDLGRQRPVERREVAGRDETVPLAEE